MSDLTLHHELMQAIDSCVLVLFFAETNSYVNALAVEAAKTAPHYRHHEQGRSKIHLAGFNANKSDMLIAFNLIRYIEGWKSARAFALGTQRGLYGVIQTLNCAVTAAGCKNRKAHCFEVVDDLSDTENGEYSNIVSQPLSYLFPCRLVKSYFRFERNLPATVSEQIQAAAVSQGCDWCQFFNADDYQPVKHNQHHGSNSNQLLK